MERNIENNSNGNSESSKIGRNASKFYKTIKNGKQSTMNNKNENNNVLVSRKKRKQFKGNEDKKSRDILELENQFISTIDFDKDSAKNLNEEPNPTTTTTTSKTTSTTISNPQQSNNISNFSTSNIILDPKMMTKSSINSKKVQIDTNESSSPTKPIPSHDGKIIFIDEARKKKTIPKSINHC